MLDRAHGGGDRDRECPRKSTGIGIVIIVVASHEDQAEQNDPEQKQPDLAAAETQDKHHSQSAHADGEPGVGCGGRPRWRPRGDADRRLDGHVNGRRVRTIECDRGRTE